MIRKLVAIAVLSLSVLGTSQLPAVAGTTLTPSAGPVDLATASIVARDHLLRTDGAEGLTVGDAQPLSDPATGRPLCYYFTLQPHGYVVVTAEKSLPPVIAYSLTDDPAGPLTPGTPLADLLCWDLSLRLDQADCVPAELAADQRAQWTAYLAADPGSVGKDRAQQWPPAGSTPTGGWVLTNWTQSAPYNNLCPLDLAHGGRSVAGCPATAMAQIVNYHARLNATQFTDADDYYHNYDGNQFWIDNAYVARSFPSWPQLNAYMHTLFDSYFYGTALSDTSKAALTYACGVAAEQVYGASGSGTFAVSQAYQAYQKFGCTTAELVYPSDPELNHRMSSNMMSAIPAHLAIVNASWTSGHNVVLDGYNTDGYYHVNFGWGGSYNGWYLIPSGLPYSLTVIEGVVVDIMTDKCGLMDCTCDGAVGLDDFAYFATCFSGPGVTVGAPGAAAFDANSDHDIDLADFAAFQTAFGS